MSDVKLDRGLSNTTFINIWDRIDGRVLSRSGFDHSPLIFNLFNASPKTLVGHSSLLMHGVDMVILYKWLIEVRNTQWWNPIPLFILRES